MSGECENGRVFNINDCPDCAAYPWCTMIHAAQGASGAPLPLNERLKRVQATGDERIARIQLLGDLSEDDAVRCIVPECNSFLEWYELCRAEGDNREQALLIAADVICGGRDA